MCNGHKFGGLWDDPERIKKYEKLYEDAFPGQTALDILHRKPGIKKKESIVEITAGKEMDEELIDSSIELTEYD